MTNQVIASVKALIEHNGKFLVLKEELRKGVVWDLPGGKIEYGEAPQATIKREVFEETGLLIIVGQTVGVWHFTSLEHKHHVICPTFHCTLDLPADQEPIIDLEHNPAQEFITEYRWLTLDEILNSSEIQLADSLVTLLQQLQHQNTILPSTATTKHLATDSLIDFYQQTERLKTTLRHSWLNDGKRQESVAEHTWMMSLLAVVLLPHFDQQLDERKIMRMIAIHDVAEAVTSDSPAWESKKNKPHKHKLEEEVLQKLFAHFDPSVASELLGLWDEYEQRTSPEAKFVKSLDCLDVLSQHNVAPISTWSKEDYEWALIPVQNAHFQWHPLWRRIKEAIDQWSIAKMAKQK